MISIETAIFLLVGALVIYGLEMFIPSAGTLFVIGTACVVCSLIVAYLVSGTTGAIFTIVVAVMALVLPPIGFQIWKRSPIGRRMFLEVPAPFSVQPDDEKG